jgi:hypothetical protein
MARLGRRQLEGLLNARNEFEASITNVYCVPQCCFGKRSSSKALGAKTESDETPQSSDRLRGQTGERQLNKLA